MIRITQRLNAGANKGILYRFCGSWKILDRMIKDGIRLSYSELTWDTGKAIDRFEDNTAAYASFTRNPSAIIATKSPGWRYALILDGSALADDYKLKPYAFYFRPGHRSYTLEEYRDDPKKGDYYLVSKGGAIDLDGVPLSKAEGDEIIRWASQPSLSEYVRLKKVPTKQVNNQKPIGIITMEDLEEMEEEDSQKPYLVNTYFLVVNLGNEETYDKKGTLEDQDKYEYPADRDRAKRMGNLKYLPVSALPKPLYRASQKILNESEERLYPHKRDAYKTKDEYTKEEVTRYKNVDIENALIGVLIPDSQYFTSQRKYFEKQHPGLPIYLYRDNAYFDHNQLDLYKLRYTLSQNPDLMKKYKFPR